MKKCNSCGIEKDLTEFQTNNRNKDRKQNKCKNCFAAYFKNNLKHKQKVKEHYHNNKDYYKNYIEENKQDRREYMRLYSQIYRKNNKSKIQHYQNTWMKSKYKTDLNYKLKQIIKKRILTGLKRNLKSGEKITFYLGCNLIQYKKFIETKFYPEMTWENHGEIWEIDHIIPIGSFNLSKIENQKLCYHYTNTQPLFKTTEIASSFGYLDYMGNRNKKDKKGYVCIT